MSNKSATDKSLNNTVHFVLQSKGGCGKTFCAAQLATYFQSIGAQVKGFDTDQENPDFFAYKGFPVEHVNIMESNVNINPKHFDEFMEKLLTEEGTFVVDNGANSFTPLLGYLIECQGLELLEQHGKKVYLHGIVGGGDTYASTLIGFQDLAANTTSPLVVWLNEHFGDLADSEGTRFHESDVYAKYADKICGAVIMHKRNGTTSAADIARMTKDRMTLSEALASPKYSILEKQRLKLFQNSVFSQLEEVDFSHGH